jgi:broad specificity phosphatase PhoE
MHDTTLVIFVRHAEKAVDPDDPRNPDPVLSKAGIARARHLAELLKDASIDTIFTTTLARTRLTAQPVLDAARAQGRPVEVTTLSTSTAPSAIAWAIRSAPGRAILVVSHSNLIPPILEELGGWRVAAMDESEYDTMYLATITSENRESAHRTETKEARLVRASYSAGLP